VSETQAEPTPLRRKPVQQRSAKRVEQMLDASAELIDELGYDALTAAVNERLQELSPEHWWNIVDSVLDIYLRMHREIPGFSKVHFGDVIDLQLLDEERDNNSVIVDSLVEILSAQVDRPAEELRFAIAIANETADALLKLAFRRDPQGDERIVAEAKDVVKGYLASKFGE
jgi:hypothetical protein